LANSGGDLQSALETFLGSVAAVDEDIDEEEAGIRWETMLQSLNLQHAVREYEQAVHLQAAISKRYKRKDEEIEMLSKEFMEKKSKPSAEKEREKDERDLKRFVNDVPMPYQISFPDEPHVSYKNPAKLLSKQDPDVVDLMLESGHHSATTGRLFWPVVISEEAIEAWVCFV
jgi:hypothetical protein